MFFGCIRSVFQVSTSVNYFDFEVFIYSFPKIIC